MPETEPTPWELMRVMREVQTDIRAIKSDAVTKDSFREFQREQREANERLGAEVAAERTARTAAIGAERASRKDDVNDVKGDVIALSERMDKIAANLKWVATGLLVPVALFIAGRLWGGA